MSRKKQKKIIHVEVVNITTRKVKKINLEEKRVFFDEETNTYQEVKNTSTSNYDNESRPQKSETEIL